MSGIPTKILLATNNRSLSSKILDTSSSPVQSVNVTTLTTIGEILIFVSSQTTEVIVATQQLEDGTVFDLLEQLDNSIPLIFLANPGEADIVLGVMEAGASDYLIQDNHGDYIKLLPHAIERALHSTPFVLSRQERLEAIISGSSDLIVMYDRGYRYVLTSDTHLEMWGNSRDELIGNHIADVLGQDFFENRAKPNLDRCLAGETIRYQTWFEFPSYGQRYLDVFSYPVHDYDNEIIGVVTSMRDLTEQKRTEGQLHFHSEALRNAAEGVHIVNIPEGKFVYVNPTFERMFGYGEGELIGQHVSILNAPTEDDPVAVAQAIMNSVSQTGYWEGEIYNIRKDGTKFWCSAKVTGFDHAEYGSVWLTVQRDIHEHKLAQDTVQIGEERFRNLVELVGAHFYVSTMSPDGIFENQYISPYVEELTGYASEKFLIDWEFWQTLIHPDDVERARTKQHLHIRNSENSICEYRISRKNNDIIWIQDHLTVQTLSDGTLTVYGVVIDITKRKEQEQKTIASQQQLQALISSQTNFVVRINLEGKVTYHNAKFAEEFGWMHPDKQTIGSHALSTICEYHHQRTIEAVEACIANPGKIITVELDKPARNQQIRTSLWEFTCLTDAEGSPLEMQCVGIDITGRKKTEDALRISEANLEKAQEIAHIGNWDWNILTGDLAWSDEVYRIFGFEPQQFEASYPAFLETVHPDDRELVEQAVQAGVDGTQRLSMDHRIVLPTGEIRTVHEQSEVTRDASGRAIRMIGIVQDITEQKAAEQQLRELNESLEHRVQERTAELEYLKNQIEAIFDNSGDGILLLDLELTILSANKTTGSLFGRSADDYLTMNLASCLISEDSEILIAAANQVTETKEKQQLEIKFKRGDVYFDGEINLSPIVGVSGEVISLVGSIRDITERKKTEKALRESEQRFRTVAENYPSYFSMIERDYTVGYTSGYEFTRAGLDPEQFIGMSTDAVYGDRFEFVKLHYDRVFEGEHQTFEMEFNGQYQVYRAVPLPDEDGSIPRILAVVENITERKQAEMAVAAERSLLRTIIDTVPDFIYVQDMDGKMLLNNHAHILSMGAQDQESVLGKTVFDLFEPKLAEKFYADDQTVLTEQKHLSSIIERSIGIAGQEIWARTTKVPLRNVDNEIVGLVGVTNDVTPLKEAEQAATNESNLLLTIIDAIPFPIYVKDKELRHTLINKNLREHYGVDVTGKTDYDLIEDYGRAESVAAQDRAILETGQILNITMSHLSMGEQEIWQEITKVPLYGDSEEIVGLVGINHDITRLKQQEQQLQYLANLQAQMKDAVIGLDLDFKIKSWNAAAEEMYGWTFEEVAGQPMNNFIKVEYLEGEAVESSVLELLREGAWEGEVLHKRRDGIRINVLSSIVMNTDRQGHSIGLIAVNRDITEYKVAEEALRESEERFRLLAEKVTDMISRHAPDGTYTYATPSAKSVTGYEPDELIGHGAYEFFHPDDVAAVQQSHTTILKQPVTYTVAYRFKQKSGNYAWLETTSHVVRDTETDKILEIISVSRDITERKEAEMQLQMLMQRLELAAQAADIGIWDGTVDGSEMYWDDRQLALYGITRKQFGNSNDTWQSLVHPEDIDHVNTNLFSAIEFDDKYREDFRIIRPDGSQRHILAIADIIRDAKGNAKRIVGINMDITEQKESEAILRNALNRERELNTLKSRFVSMASHEFRTPLASILSLTETIRVYRDRMTDEQINDRFARISDQVMYLKAMMEDVLQLERIQTGRMRFEPAATDFVCMCSEVITEFDDLPQYRGRINSELPSSEVILSVDRQLMRQVLSNLISNALKYSDAEQPVDISLSVDAGQVTLSIRDYGIGIPLDDLKSLFEPFHRASNVGTIKGTGLGLSITRRAIDAHHGTIEVDSTIGVGTTITVMLPSNVDEGA